MYLVRHCECNSNINNVYNFLNEDINENGISQAKQLRNKLENIKFDIIYSSPLVRAKHTADILNSNNVPIVLDPRLVERNPGSLAGKSYDATDRNEYWNYYSEVRYGTEESIIDLFSRIKKFLDELKNMEYERVLIVAHSGVSKAFYSYFNGIPKDGKFLKLGLKNAEIKEYVL